MQIILQSFESFQPAMSGNAELKLGVPGHMRIFTFMHWTA
jgi:hypothetical protein